MSYIILLGCKNPETARIFKMITTDENVIYKTEGEAEIDVGRINRVEGEGYAKVIAL